MNSITWGHPGSVCESYRQFESHFVRTWGQSYEDHGFSASIDDGPGLVIHVVVQVSNAWRYLQRSLAEHRKNAQVFGPVLDKHASLGQLFGNRWINDQFRRCLILDCDQRRWPFDVPGSLCRRRERVQCNRNADHGSIHDGLPCDFGAAAAAQTSLIVTSTLPRIALEYVQIFSAASTTS